MWGRSAWKRSAAGSKQRRCALSLSGRSSRTRTSHCVSVPQSLWDGVKKRQGEIECMSVTIRGALRRNGRLPRYLLSGLLVCGQCGGTFRRVNTREYGCASHVDGGHAACTNGIRVRGELAAHVQARTEAGGCSGREEGHRDRAAALAHEGGHVVVATRTGRDREG